MPGIPITENKRGNTQQLGQRRERGCLLLLLVLLFPVSRLPQKQASDEKPLD